MVKEKRLFTSESVTEGHPDKICDQISDAILDEFMRQDPNARVAVECAVKTGMVWVFGEVRSTAYVDIQSIVRETVREIGYTRGKYGFDADNLGIIVSIEEQSPDIAMGVDSSMDKEDELGAGDQGIMFGYATNETPELMPLPISLAHKLAYKLSRLRKDGELPYLRPDGKTQVTVEYDENDKPLRVDAVVVSTQHSPEISLEDLRKDIKEKLIESTIPKHLIDEDTKTFINPTGNFVIGGPKGDSGLCLAEGTLVNVKERGLLPIEQIVNGDEVTTESGSATVIETYDNGEKDTLKVYDEYGSMVEATPNHPFRVFENENIVWKEAGDLKEGDYIIQKKDEYLVTGKKHKKLATLKTKLGESQLTVNDTFAYLMGWLLGDGNTTATKSDRLTFYYNDTIDIEKDHIKSKLDEYFGSENVKSYDCQPNRFLVLSIPLYKELLDEQYIVRNTSRHLTIPTKLFGLNDKLKGSFLRGLFDADGHITVDGRNNTTYTISLTTASNQLAMDVKIMLLSMGIISKIHEVSDVKDSVGRGGSIIKAGGSIYHVLVQGNESKKAFLTKVGFDLPNKRDVYEPNNLLDKYKKNDLRLNDWVTYPVQETFRRLAMTDPIKKGRWLGGSSRPSREHDYYKGTICKILDLYDNNPANEDYIKLKYIIDNQFIFTKVKKIEPSKARTYDITLDDETHSFIANGFIVHNTGRKIIVDTYGGMGRHGGGAFSSKDVTKVDRTAAYMARYIAKNVVAAGLADKCEIQLSYAIGVAEPTSLRVETFGTGKVNEDELIKVIRKVFKLTPSGMIKQLDLRRPIFKLTAAYGHFGRELPEFTWEKTDKVEDLLNELGR